MDKVKNQDAVTLVNNGSQMDIRVNARIYPLDVVLSAAYTFLDRGYFLIDKEGRDYFKITVAARPDQGEEGLKIIAGEFENQLLNEALRAKIVKRTAKIQEAIVSAALAYSMEAPKTEPENELDDLPPEVLEVLQSDDEDLDFLDDPMGIAVPWEEKYQQSDNDSKEEESKQKE